ncbi:hypothetical protein BaRGS_00024311 [Batillaria attramentaria]|uniref:Uncharacterized protein n=1 Tax=Batillaria attramentaria TaxID=370345 RepID=A0ABD0KBE4_9CAEN
MDEEEEVANLPIMFGPDLIVADTSADNVAEGLDENAVVDSYLVEVNVEEVKELGMEFTASDEMVGSTQTEPAHAQGVIVTVADSDNSWHSEAPEDELTNEQDLIFSMYAYPWSCDCPQNEDSNYPLKSYSIEQCFCSRHKTRVVEPLTVLSQIGQAIIHQTILFTFKTEKMMHFSVAELLAKGLLKPTVTYEYLHSHGNKLWCRQANSFETSFLQHQGVWMPTSNLLTSHLLAQMMISAEFLCFLSYSESGGTRIGLKQSDIFLHQVGHICPNSSSLARRALRSIINIERLMSAWAKSCVMVNRAKDIMRKKVGENSQRHQIKALTEVKHTTQPQPPIPPEKEDTIRMLSTADCFLKLKRFVSTDLMHCPDESKKVQVHGGTEYFVCSPTNRGAEHSKSNMSKLPSDQSEKQSKQRRRTS